jgi:cytochrome c553
MARNSTTWLLVLLTSGSASFISCTGSKKSDPAKKAEAAQTPASQSASWNEKMQALSRSLSSLLPMVTSKSKFNDPKNQAQIEKDVRNLRSLAHSLKGDAGPMADPAVPAMTGLFEEDLERALEALRSGNREFARQSLRDTTSYCIQCHTQTGTGPNFPQLNLNIDTNSLTSLEQAEFFAATRQFDRALMAYERALSDEALARSNPFEWEQAARTALAITVQVKNSHADAQKLLAQIQTNAALPSSTQQALRAWKKSVRDWAKEKPARDLSPAKKLEFAQSLIRQAKNRQEFPMDHSQDILYFRASGLLHQLLGSGELKGEPLAETLYWAGVASEASRDMNFWTLHETYYEQCIRTMPSSAVAKKCFERLSESVTLGYSGSAGVNIPPEVIQRLERFKNMAEPKTSAD